MFTCVYVWCVCVFFLGEITFNIQNSLCFNSSFSMCLLMYAQTYTHTQNLLLIAIILTASLEKNLFLK